MEPVNTGQLSLAHRSPSVSTEADAHGCFQASATSAGKDKELLKPHLFTCPPRDMRESQKRGYRSGVVAHTCNPSYLGGGDCSSKLARSKKFSRSHRNQWLDAVIHMQIEEDYGQDRSGHKVRPYLKNNEHQNSWPRWLKW
jgi:hypothetical protein